jgi:hypothetical protein
MFSLNNVAAGKWNEWSDPIRYVIFQLSRFPNHNNYQKFRSAALHFIINTDFDRDKHIKEWNSCQFSLTFSRARVWNASSDESRRAFTSLWDASQNIISTAYAARKRGIMEMLWFIRLALIQSHERHRRAISRHFVGRRRVSCLFTSMNVSMCAWADPPGPTLILIYHFTSTLDLDVMMTNCARSLAPYLHFNDEFSLRISTEICIKGNSALKQRKTQHQSCGVLCRADKFNEKRDWS